MRNGGFRKAKDRVGEFIFYYKMDIQKLKECMDRSAVYGNRENGNEFDDMELCAEKGLPFPCGIIARTGCIVDRIGFAYDGFTLNHGGTGGSQQEFALRKDEHIVRVAGTCCGWEGSIAIQALVFTTDKGNVFTAGTAGMNGTRFEFKAKDGQAICAMYGRADRYVRGLGFETRKIDMDLKDRCKGIGGNMFSGLK